ncbi:DUF6082 family protein [Streptomyces sp. NPDC101062]|uniref:DUF6082 family protein n=1 Tax=unclassified Streptomyces TaxID=2593676 RepID=UPI00381DF384
MKISHAIVLASAVGAAGLRLLERQHRQRLELKAEELHQASIAKLAANPELSAVWTPPDGELPDGAYTNHLYTNSLISFLSVKFRVGLLNEKSLRVQAKWLMEHEAARAYWKCFAGFREEEARDRKDRVFNTILADEYASA